MISILKEYITEVRVSEDFLTKELNSYFGAEVKNTQEFKSFFKKEYLPYVQAENLLNFLLHLERKLKK